MAIGTYTVQIAESETEAGLDVDVYSDDGTIEASTWIDYADHGVASDGEVSTAAETEFTADVLSLDLQIERLGDAFFIRVLGDSETLVTERVTDEEWGLSTESTTQP